MWAMRVYTLPYIMTRGGPAHSSEVLSTWAYYNAFHYLRLGYGSTVAITLLILGLLVSFFIFKLSPIGKEE